MVQIKQYIFSGYVLTLLFFIYWYYNFNIPFGKSDVDNYLNLKNEDIVYYHLFFYLFSYFNFPIIFYVIFIPFLFWYGIIYPLSKIFNNNPDNIFCIFFGTAIFQQFFIVSLWEQFLSFGFFLWYLTTQSKYPKNFYYLIIPYIFLLLSLLYYPIIPFILFFLNYEKIYIIVILILISIVPKYFFFNNSVEYYNPILSVFLICPYLIYKKFKEFDTKNLFLGLSLNSLTILGRGLIYFYPYFHMNLSRKEKLIVIIWWFMVLWVFLLGFKDEWYLLRYITK